MSLSPCMRRQGSDVKLWELNFTVGIKETDTQPSQAAHMVNSRLPLVTNQAVNVLHFKKTCLQRHWSQLLFWISKWDPDVPLWWVLLTCPRASQPCLTAWVFFTVLLPTYGKPPSSICHHTAASVSDCHPSSRMPHSEESLPHTKSTSVPKKWLHSKPNRK